MIVDDLNRITHSGYPAPDAEAKSAEGNENRCAACTCHVKRIAELDKQLQAAQESLFTARDLYRMATARCESSEDQLEQARKHIMALLQFNGGADRREWMIQ